MKIISVINYKGGVGKTTIVANLVSELAWRGNKILAIDLDPQSSLTFSFISVDAWRNNYEANQTIKNWYDEFIDESGAVSLAGLIIQPSRINRVISQRNGSVDLICSHLALINIDLELATKLGGASPRQFRNNFLKVYSRLKAGLSELEQDQYDYIIIDCPPNFNIVTRNAIVCSDWYLVPAKPDYLSTMGIEQLQRHVLELVTDYNHYVSETGENAWQTISPQILGIIFTMIKIYSGQPISTQRQYINQVGNLHLPIFDTQIRENKTIYGDAPEYGVPVVLQYVTGETYENVQDELEKFTTELIGKA